MPHISVKLWPGKTEEQKHRLTAQIVKDLMEITNNSEESISITIEDVEPDDWADKVYYPEIVANQDKLYKKPGYGSLAQ